MRKQYIVMVLDESSSMGSIQAEARDAFNRQVETVRGWCKEIDIRVGLVTFSTDVRVPLWNEHPDTLRLLGPADYQPNGWTALYDAIGTAIERLEGQADIGSPDTSVLIVTITDGDENASKRWSQADIARNVQRLTDSKRWTFTYEGANHDVYKVAQNLGINPNNVMAFQASAAGMAVGGQSRSIGTSSYLDNVSKGVTVCNDFYAGTTTGTTTNVPSGKVAETPRS